MDSIVDFKICKTTIRGKIPWNILILGNIVHLWFWKYCIALGEDNKSDDLDVWIFSPRCGEFGLFWRQTWSTAPLFPGYGGRVYSHAGVLGLPQALPPFVGEDCVTSQKKPLRGRLGGARLFFKGLVIAIICREWQHTKLPVKRRLLWSYI